jgi:peroxiredoxin
VPDMPAVPLTLEGAAVLHQMFRFDRGGWKRLPKEERGRIAAEATNALAPLEKGFSGIHHNQSAIYSQFGHKGDLILIHFRDSFDDLHRAELSIAGLALASFLQPVHSYLSVVELGLYESSAKTYGQLTERNLTPHTPEWNAAVEETLERQRAAMLPRLWPAIPDYRYICFYPMDRKRAESNNWYSLSMPDRQRMMHEHGQIGRRYADTVRQIITASIGLDDWEWGVDLFADDPLVFKKLIYEMRFDEVSAVYALFGSFHFGLRVPARSLGGLLEGELPAL